MTATRRRRRRLLLRIAVPVAVLVLVLGGLAVSRYTNLFTPDRLCDGAVATADVQKVLGGGKLREVSDRMPAGDSVRRTRCLIAANPIGGDSVRLTLDTVVNRSLGSAFVVHPAFSQPDRGPVGAFGNDGGWVLLPPGCRVTGYADTVETLPDRDADLVTVETKGYDWSRFKGGEQADPGVRAALARLAADYASAIARSSGCGPADRADSHLSAAGQAPQRATPDRLCGLPGLRVELPDGTPPLTQQVSAPDAPIWTCLVTTPSESAPVLELTATPDLRVATSQYAAEALRRPLPAGWRGTGNADHGPLVVRCGSGDLYLSRTWGGSAPAELRARIATAFPDAVAAARGCEPIAPG